jgi:nitrite reductase (NO-forming)
MQGEFYVQDGPRDSGVRTIDFHKLRDEHPDNVVFNGSVGALTGEHALHARVGERIRIFFGVGGPNLDQNLSVFEHVSDLR